MANKRPLALYAGEIREIPDSDTILAILLGGVLRQGVFELYVPVAFMVPRATNGGEEGVYDSGSNDITLPVLAFDPNTQEFAHFALWAPKSLNLGTTFTFAPLWTNTGGASTQTVAWTCAAVAIGNDDPLNATFGTAQSSIDTWLAQNDQHTGPESAAITIAGSPAQSDLVVFEISRNVASDNMAGDALLIGARLRLPLNLPNDD